MISRGSVNLVTLIFTPLALSLLFAIACGGAAAPPVRDAAATTPPQAAATSAPAATAVATKAPAAVKRFETLFVAQIGNPVSLTCWDYSATDEADILVYFADAMFSADRDAVITGSAVDEWEMESLTSWRLHLREGMKAHDPKYGVLDAEDAVASMDSCLREGAKSITRNPAPIVHREVEILDENTFRMTLQEPGAATVPNYLGNYVFVSPKEYLAEVEDFSKSPLGGGALRFVEWLPNERIVGERFEDWWGPELAFDRIEWRIIPDAFTRKAELLTGGLDILPFLVPEVAEEVESNACCRVSSTLSARFVYAVLPVRRAPYDDVRVRQALNYAIDKQEIVDTLFRGIGAIPMTGINHAFLPEYDPNRVGYPFNPEKAKQLLAEARADGVTIDEVNLFATNDRYTLDKETGEAVAGYWRDVLGLEVEYFPQSRSELFPKGMALEMQDPWQIGNGNSLVRVDGPYALWFQKRSDPRSRGDEYAAGTDEWDKLIDDLSLTASGSPESIKLSRELDRIYTEFAPWAFLVNYIDLYGINDRIEWEPYSTERRLFYDLKLK